MSTLPEATAARDPDSPVDHDVVVVGGGASGLSAAVFLARYGLETLVLARGKSAIHQCAHLENYLGFPAGISPERFVDLGETQVEHEGGTVEHDLVERVAPHDAGFRVRTQDDRDLVASYVLFATAYDGTPLEPLEAHVERDDDHGFLHTEDGRTAVDGLYAAGWLTDDTVHQAAVNAGDGARAAIALARDDLADRYWEDLAEIYVDWVVDDDRYGGDDWHANTEEWFDREIAPGAPEDLDEDDLAQVREDAKTAFLDRCITAAERERRDERGQRHLLDALDDDVVRAYVDDLDA
jgi:alkyl hydroperoxide reductase subunit AhpF